MLDDMRPRPAGAWILLESVGVIVSIASLLVIYLPGLPMVGRWFYPFGYRDTIVAQARVYGLDPLFVAAVIRQESGFRPHAHSAVGAVGLMQLMPETARWASKETGLKNFQIDQLEEPEVNIKLGCWYLSHLFAQFKEPDKVLMAYNGGEGNVSAWQSQQGEQLAYAYPETQTYVGATMRAFQRYQALYRDELAHLAPITVTPHGNVRIEHFKATPAPGAHASPAHPSPKPSPAGSPKPAAHASAAPKHASPKPTHAADKGSH